MELFGKRVLVLGLAREGASLARFLATKGAEVTVTDSATIEKIGARLDEVASVATVHLGADQPELTDGVDILFVSPGIPETNPVYRAAVERGLPVESMTTLFFELCPAPIIGITGSSGKTTTTSLLGHILRHAGRDVVVGGNIGEPMVDLLPDISSESLVLLELSSFQLQLLSRSPHIAVVTNVSPNHLDRHGDMARYIAAKRHIVENQTHDDLAVLNGDDPTVTEFAQRTPAGVRWFGGGHDSGAGVENGMVVLRDRGSRQSVIPIHAIPLLGRHNVENVLAATTVAASLGVEPSAMSHAIREYRPPEHRLQCVGQRDGIRFIDDSIATTPERSMVAMQAVEGPIIVIAGGRDKALPWETWAEMVAARARALLLIGEAQDMIYHAVRHAIERDPGILRADMIVRCASMDAAVLQARAWAQSGDTVVLAPGCASYDMFTDYHERGLAFAHAVENLDAA